VTIDMVICRLFFNRHSKRTPWSVDGGHDTRELWLRSVVVKAEGRTVYDGTVKDIRDLPSAWIEFKDVKLEISGDEGIISSECTRGTV